MPTGQQQNGVTEIIEWVNDTLGVKLPAFQYLVSGSIACRLFNSLFPNTIPSHMIRYKNVQVYERQLNFILLQDAITSKRLVPPPEINFDDIVHGNKLGITNLYRWLKELDKNRQTNTKRGSDKKKGMRIQHKATYYYDDRGDLQSIEHKPSAGLTERPMNSRGEIRTADSDIAKLRQDISQLTDPPFLTNELIDSDFKMLNEQEHQVLQSLEELEGRLNSMRVKHQ